MTENRNSLPFVFDSTELVAGCHLFSMLCPLYLPDTSYETSGDRNSENIERRTLNVQHRTSNIDDATLYLFYNKPIAACDELSQIEFRSVDSLVQRRRSRSASACAACAPRVAQSFF